MDTIEDVGCDGAAVVVGSEPASRGGRDNIDHPPSGHDDVANAIAGLAFVAINRFRPAPAVFGHYAVQNRPQLSAHSNTR